MADRAESQLGRLKGSAFRSTTVDIGIFVATISSMILINREWLLSGKGWIDTWMYVGYFLHYDAAGYLADNKKIARLPWILLGFFVYKYISPILASYVLHAGLLIAGTLTFYRLANKFFGRQAAILGSLTYMTSQITHGSGGWDYHNTLTPVLYFLSFLSFDSALLSGRRPFLAFSKCGALLALTLHTNLLIVLVAPVFLVHALFRMRSAPPQSNWRRWTLIRVGGLIVGFGIITACLGLVNVTFGRQFFFFLPLLNRSAQLLASSGLERMWWQPWSDLWWIGDDSYNLHMALVEATLGLILLFSIIALIRRRLGGRRMTPVLVAINVEYITSVAFASLLQTLGHPILQPGYMAFSLNFPMFLSLTGLISYALPQGSQKTPRLNSPILVTTLAALAACAFVAQVSGRLTIPDSYFEWGPPRWENKIPILLAMVALGGGAMLSRIRLPSLEGRMLGGAACFAWIAMILGQLNADWPDRTNPWNAYAFGSNCFERQSIFSAVIDADKLLYPLQRSGRHVIVWYNAEEQHGPSESCKLGAMEVGRPLFAMGYSPELHYWDVEASRVMPKDVINELDSGRDAVVVISSNKEYVTQLLGRLQQHDGRWHESANYTVGRYDIAFGMHLFSGETAAPSASAPGLQSSTVSQQPVAFHAQAENGSTIQRRELSARIEIHLPRRPWAYGARVAFALPTGAKSGTLFLDLRLTTGTAAVGVLNHTGTDFLARRILHTTSGSQTVALEIADWSLAGPIIVESADSADGGDIMLSSMSFLPRPDSSQQR